jgi:CheY-like chemotaxis protein
MKAIKSIGLVDDDEVYVFLTKKVIEITNLIDLIIVFKNGLQALNYLKENTPDLIFLDIDLPHINGWQFLHQYQHFPNKSKIVILTSSIDPTDKERALAYDCVDGFIVKPLNSQITRTELEKV